MKIKKYIPIFTIFIMAGIIIGQNLAFMTGGYRFLRRSEQPYNAGKYYEGSPYPRVTKDMINVDNSKSCIYGNYEWASFTDTGSMHPTLDYGHYAIQMIVTKDTKIFVGDIISYRLTENDTIIHRVIDIKSDNNGVYYITQGDSLKAKDPLRVRHSMVERVVVAIIY